MHTPADRSLPRASNQVAKLHPKRGTLTTVADETRPPIAIRSIRPYATEEAFLAEERDTLTRTAVTLIGAPSRPRGVVLRFEVTLSDGTPIVRGEGRVLGFQPADDTAPSALTLRFTRLDAKSKAFIDRAAALREATPPPTPPPAADTGDMARPTEAPGPPTEAPGPRTEAPGPPTDPPGLPTDAPPPPTMATVAPPTLPEKAPSADHVPISLASSSLPVIEVRSIGNTPPPPLDPTSREGLLAKLRDRARALPAARVAEILATPRSQS